MPAEIYKVTLMPEEREYLIPNRFQNMVKCDKDNKIFYDCFMTEFR